MPALRLFQGDPLCSDIVGAIVTRNEHVLLPDGVSHTVLDDVTARLAGLRSRVFRLSTLDTVTLPGLLSQVVGHESHVTVTAPDLERGFEMLTDIGADFDRVVLVLDRADALEPAALRYIQFATREFPLRLVFAGGLEMRTLLAREEFASLRRSFVEYTPASEAELPVMPIDIPLEVPRLEIAPPPPALAAPVITLPEHRPVHLVRRRGWLLAGTGIAASVAGLAWLIQSGALTPYLEANSVVSAMFRPHAASTQP